MVNLLFGSDGDALQQPGVVRTLFDPAAGTGGMLSVAEEYLRELNPDASLVAFGQDHNPESYAVCGSDMLIKGQNIDRIVFGSSFSKDGFWTTVRVRGRSHAEILPAAKDQRGLDRAREGQGRRGERADGSWQRASP